METVLEEPASKNAQQPWIADGASIRSIRRKRMARWLFYLAFVTLVPVPTLLIVDAWTFSKDIAEYPWLQILLVSVFTNGVFIAAFLIWRSQLPQFVHGVTLGANEIRLECPGRTAVIVPVQCLDSIRLWYDAGGSLLAIRLRYRASLWPWHSMVLSAKLLPLSEIWPSLDEAVPNSVPRKIGSMGKALFGFSLALLALAFLVLDSCAIFFSRMWLYPGI